MEEQVMDIIWNKKLCSVHDAHEILLKQRKIAYTTVATVFQRLEQKGFITKKIKGFANLYKPRISREAYGKRLADNFLSSFIKSFGDVAIASFADSIERLSPKKRAYLLKLLEKNVKNK